MHIEISSTRTVALFVCASDTNRPPAVARRTVSKSEVKRPRNQVSRRSSKKTVMYGSNHSHRSPSLLLVSIHNADRKRHMSCRTASGIWRSTSVDGV